MTTNRFGPLGRWRLRSVFAAVAAAAITAGLAACGSSSSSSSTTSSTPATSGGTTTSAANTSTTAAPISGTSSADPATSGTVSVSVGTSTPIKLTLPLKVAVFQSAGTASFGAAEDSEMQSYAKAHNISLTIFDAAFNPTLQYNQIQAAIQDKKYNVIGVLPVEGTNICKELSTSAPAANLLVTDFDQPLCGRFTQEGNGLWQPGTLNYISGYDTKATLQEWIDAIVKANPGPQTVGVVEGVATDGLSTNTNNILKGIEKTDPNFHIVGTENTDYSSAEGYTDTQSLLAAHPNITVLISDQSNITEGIARAVSQAGKSKKVFVADYGGDSAIVSLIKQGEVSLTTPTWPTLEGKTVLQVLSAVSHGQSAKRLISLPFEVITPKNVSSYSPEY